MNTASLDRWITGNYGQDQFSPRFCPQCYSDLEDAFIERLDGIVYYTCRDCESHFESCRALDDDQLDDELRLEAECNRGEHER